jgi:glycosyltransferase involved in cell wall biosynthesis
VTEPELPSFDLVVATVGRVEPLERLLASLERQTYRAFRVLLVDQNDDDRLASFVRNGIERLRSQRGLSRARNAALGRLTADVVAFPDDDCVYPPDLLERVARRFAADATLDGLTGRDQSPSWPQDAARLDRDNVWNRAISFTIFVRRGLVERVGGFDERLGLPHSSGEEIDFLIGALEHGAKLEYDPTLVVTHDASKRERVALGARDGESVGYILRKHRYPPQTVTRMLARPVAGTVLTLARGDLEGARFHLATARGRLRGYRR